MTQGFIHVDATHWESSEREGSIDVCMGPIGEGGGGGLV